MARYADTKGYVFNEERRYPYAYTYRDYVVAAFNDDLPYDRFVVEQLAADQLPLGEDRRPLAAMGFLTLGRRFLNNIHDIIDDRIDVGDARPAGADGELRPLPRPQVRPHPDARLLLAVRRLRQLRRAGASCRCCERPTQSQGIDRVREGVAGAAGEGRPVPGASSTRMLLPKLREPRRASTCSPPAGRHPGAASVASSRRACRCRAGAST